jgi:hypothetical protein
MTTLADALGAAEFLRHLLKGETVTCCEEVSR